MMFSRSGFPRIVKAKDLLELRIAVETSNTANLKLRELTDDERMGEGQEAYVIVKKLLDLVIEKCGN